MNNFIERKDEDSMINFHDQKTKQKISIIIVIILIIAMVVPMCLSVVY